MGSPVGFERQYITLTIDRETEIFILCFYKEGVFLLVHGLDAHAMKILPLLKPAMKSLFNSALSVDELFILFNNIFRFYFSQASDGFPIHLEVSQLMLLYCLLTE